MKKIVLVFLIVIPSLLQAQSYVIFQTSPTKKVFVDTVIQVDNMSADELYIKAKTWFGENFGSAKEVISFDSKETHQIFGTYTSKYRIVGTYSYFKHSIKFYAKDNRFKIVIDNITSVEYKHNIEFYLFKKNGEFYGIYKNLKLDCENGLNSIVNSLIKYLSQPSTPNDSW